MLPDINSNPSIVEFSHRDYRGGYKWYERDFPFDFQITNLWTAENRFCSSCPLLSLVHQINQWNIFVLFMLWIGIVSRFSLVSSCDGMAWNEIDEGGFISCGTFARKDRESFNLSSAAEWIQGFTWYFWNDSNAFEIEIQFSNLILPTLHNA